MLHLTGAPDYQLRVACRDTAELDMLLRTLRLRHGAADTETTIVLRSGPPARGGRSAEALLGTGAAALAVLLGGAPEVLLPPAHPGQLRREPVRLEQAEEVAAGRVLEALELAQPALERAGEGALLGADHGVVGLEIVTRRPGGARGGSGAAARSPGRVRAGDTAASISHRRSAGGRRRCVGGVVLAVEEAGLVRRPGALHDGQDPLKAHADVDVGLRERAHLPKGDCSWW